MILENTKKGRIDITPYGQTSQESTTGKNLLNATNNSLSFPTDNTQVKLVGTIDLVAGTTYYISYDVENATSSNTRNTPRLKVSGESTSYFESSNTNYNLTMGRKSWEFICPTTATYELGYWVQGANVETTIDNFMISTSNDITYEPFTNGPAPNPDYPFRVKKVTGDNNIKIENKNLHEEQNYPLTLGDLEVYKDGYFFKNEIDSEDYNSNLDLNEWYLKNYYGKVVLDGSENWQSWNIVTTEPLVGFLLDGYADYDNSSGTDVRGLSNYFKVFANAMPNQQSIGLRQTGDSIKRIYLAISNEIVSNLTEFKSWLSNHNTELVYLSATPLYTKITSQTLTEQLNNLKNNAKSYKDVTYITQTNDELPFILEIKEIEDDQLIDDLSKINEFLRVNL